MLLSQPRKEMEPVRKPKQSKDKRVLSIPVRKITNENQMYNYRGMHVTLDMDRNANLVGLKLFHRSCLWKMIDGYYFEGWGVDETIKLVREENGYTIRFCDWILEFECSNVANEEIIHIFHAALVDAVKLRRDKMTKFFNEPDEGPVNFSSEDEDSD